MKYLLTLKKGSFVLNRLLPSFYPFFFIDPVHSILRSVNSSKDLRRYTAWWKNSIIALKSHVCLVNKKQQKSDRPWFILVHTWAWSLWTTSVNRGIGSDKENLKFKFKPRGLASSIQRRNGPRVATHSIRCNLNVFSTLKTKWKWRKKENPGCIALLDASLLKGFSVTDFMYYTERLRLKIERCVIALRKIFSWHQ